MQQSTGCESNTDPDVPATLIIVVYNTPELVLQCLAGFYPSLQTRGWQVVVVDNGSDVDIRPIVQGKFNGVEVIRSEQNRGFSGGNNLGLRVARGRCVILMNSDIIADAETLESLVASLQSESTVGAMSPGLFTLRGAAQAFAFGSETSPRYLIQRGLRAVLGSGAMHDWSARDPLEVGWVSAACLCVRRKVIEEIGVLDERFPLYFEDTDWCLRMRAAGWKIIYNPHLKVTHLGGASRPSGTADKSALYYRSLILFCEKHYGRAWGWGIRVLLVVYRILAAFRSSSGEKSGGNAH